MADSDFGLRIGIEGERDFKAALREINQSFKVLGSETALVTSQFDKNDKSVNALTARNAVLNKEIDAQKEKISTLKTALDNAASSFGENDRRTQNWQIQLNKAQAELMQMALDSVAGAAKGNFTLVAVALKGLHTMAVFSKEYENIIEHIFTRSISDLANFAIVGGEGEGTGRTIVGVGDGAGDGRYEIFVDAKDLRSEDFPDDYIAALSFRGNQKLAEKAMTKAFDVTVNQYVNGTEAV